MIILVLIVFGLLALSDFPPLVKSRKWYEVAVLSALYVFALVLAALYTFDVVLPSPIKGVQKLIVDVLKVGYPEP